MAEEDKAAREQWQRIVRDVERKRKGAPAVAPPEPAARVVDQRSVALDGSPGFRALAWIHLGTHELSAGEHKIEFLLGSDGSPDGGEDVERAGLFCPDRRTVPTARQVPAR